MNKFLVADKHLSKLLPNFYIALPKLLNVEKERINIVKIKTENLTEYKVNDLGFRLILIPFFGIAIPLITGLINRHNISNPAVRWSFLYTIMIALVVWQGNRYLHSSLRNYFDWINKPLQKVLVLILSVVFYTVPVSVLLIVGWYELFTNEPVNWQVVSQATLIILIAVIFITHVYETVILVKQSENEMIRNEQLERARAEAELEALKNQIDPHFIFNSLNTLSHLIEEKPARAKQFNDTLADVYRYILQNKARDLVLLRDEIEFLNSYFLLLKIRFEKAVHLEKRIDDAALEHFLLPPICLQLLAENAIKHNEFSAESPLIFSVHLEDDALVVKNKLQRKELRKPSSRIGLNNLKERYKLTTGKEIRISDDNNEFVVRLPVLNLT
ncbi:MAG: histidine kinase [Chitinophagaceae bacterium]